jgi:ABC-type bacteriocin/lantibiotic exporter with double-glycine peptidase domain
VLDTNLKKISFILNKSTNVKLIYLLISTLTLVLLELFSISLIIPLITVITDSKIYYKYHNYSIFKILNINSSYELSIFLILLFLFVYLLKSIITYFGLKFQSKINSKLIIQLSNYLFEIFLKTKYSDYLNKNITKITKLNHIDVYHFGETLRSYIFIISELSVLFSVVIVSFFINTFATFFLIIYFAFLSYLYFSFVKKKLSNIGISRQENLTLKLDFLYQSIIGFKEIKIFNNSLFYKEKIKLYNSKYEKENNKIIIFGQIPRIYFEFILIFSICLVLYYFTIKHINFNDLIPIFSFYLLASLRILPSLNKIIVSLQNISSFKSSVINIYNEIISFSEVSNDNLNTSNPESFESLKFENISFNYQNSTSIIFKNLSFEIFKGDKIVITGSSGSGKTTLIDLIVSLINHTEGQIYYNNVKISNTEHLRNNNLFSYNPQNVFLFNSTLKENILFGLDFDKERFHQVCQSLSLDKIFGITYDNFVIKDRGLNLSGGQKQRIGLARALYRSSPILILDESTNALDEKSERQILNDLLSIRDLTLICITHNEINWSLFNKKLNLNNDFN